MKVSRLFLEQYIGDLKSISTQEICDALTSLGLEVESVSSFASGSNLVVAKVLKKDKHPDSSKLSVCLVDTGTEEVQVVCGAQNVDAGQLVIFAQVGSILPGNFKIKKSEIRGVESNGMICSLSELGVESKFLSEESKEGIEVLDSELYSVGDDPLVVGGLGTDVIEIGLTPNRSDCHNALQIAKEIAGFFNLKVEGIDPARINIVQSKELIKSSKCSVFTLTEFFN